MMTGNAAPAARVDGAITRLSTKPNLMDVVRRYSRLRVWRSARAIAFDWFIIAVCFAAAIRFPHPAVWIVAGIVITGRQHALLVLMHEGAHFRLHPRRAVNDWIGDWLLAFPFLVSTRGYRNNHIAHHSHLNTDADPDWVRKLAHADWDLPKTKWMLAGVLLRDFFGGGMLDQLRSIGHLRGEKRAARASEPGSRSRTLGRTAYYAIVAAAVTAASLWIPVLVLWFLPAFILLPVVLRIRSIAEHFALPGETEFNSSRNYLGPWWERAFFTPHNVGYHLDHHLFPSIPFYNLPDFHRFLNRDRQYRRFAYHNDSLFRPTGFSVMNDVVLGDDEEENRRKAATALNHKRRAMKARR